MGKIRGNFRQARLDYQSRVGRVVTIEDVAAEVNISRQSMSDIENGKSLPRYKTLAALCKLYGVQPGDLLEYEERRRRYTANTQPATV